MVLKNLIRLQTTALWVTESYICAVKLVQRNLSSTISCNVQFLVVYNSCRVQFLVLHYFLLSTISCDVQFLVLNNFLPSGISYGVQFLALYNF